MRDCDRRIAERNEHVVGFASAGPMLRKAVTIVAKSAAHLCGSLSLELTYHLMHKMRAMPQNAAMLLFAQPKYPVAFNISGKWCAPSEWPTSAITLHIISRITPIQR